MTEFEIKADIKDHMDKNGGYYPNWYVGVSKEPRERLFNGHSVEEKRDAWIYREATNSIVARRVEKYFCDIVGTDGGSGGGDEDACYVYAYKKNSHTRP